MSRRIKGLKHQHTEVEAAVRRGVAAAGKDPKKVEVHLHLDTPPLPTTPRTALSRTWGILRYAALPGAILAVIFGSAIIKNAGGPPQVGPAAPTNKLLPARDQNKEQPVRPAPERLVPADGRPGGQPLRLDKK